MNEEPAVAVEDSSGDFPVSCRFCLPWPENIE